MFYSGFAKDGPSDSKLMVMLGMIFPYKGFEDAIEIVHKIRAKGLDFRLHIEGAGSKEYIEKLRRLIAKLELNDSVTIQEGYVHIERLIGLYNLAFVTLMPYKRIEQSGVAFTSLGLKVPVVSYGVGGIKEVIKDKINGRIVPLNDIETFYDAILWTSHNRELLHSNLSQKYYSDYWDQNARILLSEYFTSENESKSLQNMAENWVLLTHSNSSFARFFSKTKQHNRYSDAAFNRQKNNQGISDH